MTEGDDTVTERPCVSCGEVLPTGRSVCPACGTLQQTLPVEPHPEPQRTPGPGSIAPAPATGEVPAALASDPTPPRRRSKAKVAAAVLVGLALIGAAAFAAVELTSDGDDTAATTTTSSTPVAGEDPRTPVVAAYCDDPRPLTGPGEIAVFTPGQGTVAVVELPQPTSSTDPVDQMVLQVSPTVGQPDLELDAAINIVSLAVCLEETSTKATPAECDYELTNPEDLGKEATAPLITTTYEARIIELVTGETLTKGPITTAAEDCPSTAFVDGEGVSNAITEAELSAWIGEQLPGGIPS